MSILIYRDFQGKREFVGRIDYEVGASSNFTYDAKYLEKAQAAGELGISYLLPLDGAPYSSREFNAYFQGLMPEGDIYSNLAEYYQVPRADYLSILEQMGCESIGALTFVSERINLSEYEPRYDQVDAQTLSGMRENPVRMATITAASTRLSLSGAQSKVAWFLPDGVNPANASPNEWFIPRGTAPSTHIIKISRTGEEDLAINELACSLLSQACGIDTAKIIRLPELPGVICVERYDRVRMQNGELKKVVRLHQEDFCQALGLSPFFKYQPQGVAASYPVMISDLLEETTANPQESRIEFAKRLVFCYAVGNSDAHLKNFSLLYNKEWTVRNLAPLYDVTCIPLSGYSTAMPFDIGEHRALNEIDEADMVQLATDLSLGLSEFGNVVNDVLSSLETPKIKAPDKEADVMINRILENAKPRLNVLKRYLGKFEI